VQVAFCGRSNVGKSSLINAVTLSTTVRSSDKPGMTQQVSSPLLLVGRPGSIVPRLLVRAAEHARRDAPSRANTHTTTYTHSHAQGQFNFFVLPQRLMFADLPGYGFAFANPHKVKSPHAITCAIIQ
jgi:GTP-binding protein EngB required for normal cell division